MWIEYLKIAVTVLVTVHRIVVVAQNVREELKKDENNRPQRRRPRSRRP
jgi:hypothetical protein